MKQVFLKEYAYKSIGVITPRKVYETQKNQLDSLKIVTVPLLATAPV